MNALNISRIDPMHVQNTYYERFTGDPENCPMNARKILTDEFNRPITSINSFKCADKACNQYFYPTQLQIEHESERRLGNFVGMAKGNFYLEDNYLTYITNNSA